MQILHGTVALSATIVAMSAYIGQVTICEFICSYSPHSYSPHSAYSKVRVRSWNLTKQRSQCCSHLLCNFSCIWKLHVIKFFPFLSDFLEKQAHILLHKCQCVHAVRRWLFKLKHFRSDRLLLLFLILYLYKNQFIVPMYVKKFQPLDFI